MTFLIVKRTGIFLPLRAYTYTEEIICFHSYASIISSLLIQMQFSYDIKAVVTTG